MSNPARDLYDLFQKWRDTTTGITGSRTTLLRIGEDEGANDVLRAYRLLNRLDDILRRYELDGVPVSLYRRQVRGWSRVPLSIENGWATTLSAPDHIVPSSVMDQVEGLALFLHGKVHEIDADQSAEVSTLVQQAWAALLEDESLPTHLRHYLHSLLQEIRVALDDEVVGKTFDMASALERLWVALRAASGASTDPGKTKRWRDLADSILVGTTSGLVIEAGKIVLALTPGITG